ncbi:MAG: c-type cytochrome biogenesis protein CcmI [Alphaproteobacteria bacterium]|nr:c-type cytochrome biogenesis protein CcmI [Alphaproteobacteria bacterium]MDP6813755.1 c-type cytochrome biogenesis protein CcmI [Alphaproteobacteria bacterium]
MSLWLAIGGLTLLALVPLLWPLLRPPRPAGQRLDHDLEVYRDQLRELAAEAAEGAISETEAAEARREIERRILRAADAGKAAVGGPVPSAVTAVLIALAVPAIALLLYAQLGRPGEGDRPLTVERQARAEQGGAPDAARRDAPRLEEMAERLAERLRDEPDDGQRWSLLGRTYLELGRTVDAVAAYRRALAIIKDDPALFVIYGQTLLSAADGQVTPDAVAAFRRARELAPAHPGARYFLAMADWQAGRSRAAYDAWLSLAGELPKGSPNRRAVVEKLRAAAEELGLDLAADLPAGASAKADLSAEASAKADDPATARAPGPDQGDIAATADMSQEDRAAFIRSMVQRLSDRLADNPEDFDGWMRLGHAHDVLGDTAKSAEAYGRAAALRGDDPAPLNAQARVLVADAAADQPLPESTLAVLRRLEKLQPDNARALWFLGLTDAVAGRRAAAITRWRRLHAQMPEGSAERDSLRAALEQLETAAQ